MVSSPVSSLWRAVRAGAAMRWPLTPEGLASAGPWRGEGVIACASPAMPACCVCQREAHREPARTEIPSLVVRESDLAVVLADRFSPSSSCC
jgi:hypothetical protein